MVLTEQYADKFQAFSNHTMKASNDGMLVLDTAWRAEATRIATDIMALGEDVRQLEPSPDFELTHSHMLDAADHYDLAMLYFLTGVDNIDGDMIGVAVDEIDLGNRCIERATQALP